MKLKLKVIILADGSMVLETTKPFKKFSECKKLLNAGGYVKDDECGNLIRFTSSFATAYVVVGPQTHPYSHPEKHLFNISIYY